MPLLQPASATTTNHVPQKEKASLGSMTSLLGCVFSASTAPIGCRGLSGKLARGMRGRKVLVGGWEGGSTRVPPFPPGAADEKKYPLQLGAVRRILARETVAVEDSVTEGEICVPRYRGASTLQDPRVSGESHGLTAVPDPSSSFFLSCFFAFLTRAGRNEAGRPPRRASC